ncbi:hypothetical protein HDU80_000817 [Chytriomyces hyalinus]|nr:hypothetical protein HDU80_000817 [Chytriomyces hyalinus]
MLSFAILDLIVTVFLICFIGGSILSILHRIIPHKGGPCQYVESVHALMRGKTAVSSQQTIEPQRGTPDPSASIEPVHTLTKEDDGFVLVVEVPGYKAYELTVVVKDDIRQVVLYGRNPRTEEKIYLATTFSRLGDFKKVGAFLEDGILKVTVGKLKRDGRLVQVMIPKQGAE